MKYTPKPIKLSGLRLPSADLFADYRQLRRLLETAPATVSPELSQAFCQLALSVEDPSLLDMQEAALIEKLHPEQWKAYCHAHWGDPSAERISFRGPSPGDDLGTRE